jgi:hypothetical protein
MLYPVIFWVMKKTVAITYLTPKRFLASHLKGTFFPMSGVKPLAITPLAFGIAESQAWRGVHVDYTYALSGNGSKK